MSKTRCTEWIENGRLLVELSETHESAARAWRLAVHWRWLAQEAWTWIEYALSVIQQDDKRTEPAAHMISRLQRQLEIKQTSIEFLERCQQSAHCVINAVQDAIGTEYGRFRTVDAILQMKNRLAELERQIESANKDLYQIGATRGDIDTRARTARQIYEARLLDDSEPEPSDPPPAPSVTLVGGAWCSENCGWWDADECDCGISPGRHRRITVQHCQHWKPRKDR